MLIFRPEGPADAEAIGNVNRKAFGRENEARLVAQLRRSNSLTISLVALQDNEIVGHIAFNPVILAPGRPNFRAIALAPLAVRPDRQNQGIGTALVMAGLDECRRLGYDAVVLVGHPGYYPRFGFEPAEPKGLQCEYEGAGDAWMVRELITGALPETPVKIFFRPEFKECV